MANTNYNKLELTWIGKGDEYKLEPRILIEESQYSFGDKESKNILIHGDNLLALKAIEQDFTNKIKCIYIDPPYNTGSAFEQYDDNTEHSIWLNLMIQRIKILKNLLSEDGFIFINIDDNEQAYLTILLDEIFGRNNKFDKISVKTSSSQGGFGGVNPGLVSNTEYILLYAKDRTKASFNETFLYTEKEYDENYTWMIVDKNKKIMDWEIINLNEIVYRELELPEPYNNQTWREMEKKYGESWKSIRTQKKAEIALKNPDNVFRTFNPNKPAAYLKNVLDQSKLNRDVVMVAKPENGDEKLCLNGEVILFYSKMMKHIDNELKPVQFLTTFWSDIPWEGISNEGGVQLRNGKKPEKLIKRILEITTFKNDYVLDSFLGSGTTAAVAHKMGRKYIGIELGEHAITHCFQRLKAVVNGEQSGISKSVNWNGGGGFRFYNLAPSLLNEDKYGNWVISKEYNSQMLAAAMAKQEGFIFEPNQQIYWKQGKSTEKDYIYTTTQFITVELLDKIKAEMLPEESLLIACKSFQEGCENRHTNIGIKKMPQLLLGRCEFGKEDYSFNIINLPSDEDTENDKLEEAPKIEAISKKKKISKSSPELFD
jgi:adenine-specific DNA-methyltransferase